MDSTSLSAAETSRDLADLLQAALLDDGAWHRFLTVTAQLLPNGRATLLHHDPSRSSGALHLQANIPEAMLLAYQHRLSRINPWMPYAARRPIGLVSTTRTVMAPANLRRTEFHADFLRPLDLGQGLGLTLARRDGIDFALSVLGAEGEEAQTRTAMAALQGLAPRLGNAFAARRRMALAAGSARFGTVRLGAHGVVIEADAAAAAAFTTGDPFLIDARGRLRCRQADIEQALSAWLSEWGSPSLTTAVRRWLVPRGEGRLPLRATLVRPGRTAVERYFVGPEAVLTLEDPERYTVDLPTLRSFLGLTEAESRVLGGIVAGSNLAEIAVLHGTALETVRSQAKAVLRKASCRTQVELVGLVHRLAGNTRP